MALFGSTRQKVPAVHIAPEPGDLRRFKLLQDLSEDQLQQLASRVSIRFVPAQTQLIKRGDSKSEIVLLLKGTLELIAADGRRQRFDDKSPGAQSPIAQLLPRRYDVISVTPVEYLHFNTQLLDELREDKTRVEDPHPAEDLPVTPVASSLDFLDCLTRDLEQDRFVLSSLPDIAESIGEGIREHGTHVKQMARLVQLDPAMTAKLVKAANGPQYTRKRPIQSCQGALSTLGLDAIHQLMGRFLQHDLFRPANPALEARMREVRNHSVQVAALCYVLARLTGKFPPKRALLAGLLHDIGVMGILANAERYPVTDADPNLLDGLITGMRATLGEMILSRWQLPEHVISVARESEDWMREAPELDYCDLVIVAKIHSYMGTPKALEVPSLDEIPAFQRLGMIDLTPKMSMKILKLASEQVERVESLFRGVVLPDDDA
ncbi:Cyclic nucleotide-binding protein [Gammaproteobacteria bacterium]